MLLKPVGNWLDLRLNKYIKKPLFTCPMCMASFWTLVYWLYTGAKINEMTFIMMLVVCGINTVLTAFVYAYHEEPNDLEPITNNEQCLMYEQMISDIIWKGPYQLNKLSPEQKAHVREIKSLLNEYYLEEFIKTLV